MAKKSEAAREEFEVAGIRDVDAVLTSSELIEMVDELRITKNAIEPADFDGPYKKVSGAGILFGASGGVAEAALRMAVSKVGEGEVKNRLEFEDVRGLEGIKVSKLTLGGKEMKVAVVSGLAHVEPIVRQIIDTGVSEFDLIEVMACPGGCISGAGHPAPKMKSVLKDRQEVLVALDEKSKVRRSEENPDLLKLYDDFYGEANSKKAHRYLHTNYNDLNKDAVKNVFNKDNSTWKIHEIQVCMDDKCSSKGSYTLLESIRQIISEQQLERFFVVNSGLHTGHSYPEEIFVSLDGRRVAKEELANLEDWLVSQCKV
jgi:formate dehydrogenase major subunit